MDDVRGAGPVRPNLWADQLTSYAFSVKATIGQNPMRYLVARRFDGDSPAQALTMLFVLQPQVLFGTYVRISEGAFGGGCEVDTFLPTMARPVRVAEALMFDCLPLTDVGYVDLMAWPHPALLPLESSDGDAGPPGSTHTVTLRYQGPPSVPTLVVREEIDVDLSIVVRRVLCRDGRQVRRWEIAERGGAGQEALPRRIRVSRPQTGHETEFVRASPAVPVPPAVFDAKPEQLREWIEQRMR
ncbi:hypothetical protein [Actinomadura alba]|uniref:Uncharacterized protein n=1 Tax=Actinomadura alba TaxID=406431 RepID=A0ABR7M0X3_9ACTN|nr:hypothetical protein [Actinomadura alba]MBC6470263.1 hypothetical protein [Actinomadura alba]